MKTILVDAVDTFVIEGEGVSKKMHELLETYPNRKVLLTGADDDQFRKFGLHKMPYYVFTLKHDPEKTDPAYFQKLLTHFNLTAGDVIYFEHNPAAVESARSTGIVSYHYDEGKHDLVALKKFIDTNI